MRLRFLKILPRLSDENRYYLRDIFIFFLTLGVSIGFSELVFFRQEEDISFFSKLDTYLFILIPFFILSLILSYVYRNRRNRETGKIRSSIRYRLTLAFLFVALVPSLPIFILSSNLTGRLIEGFYRVDISNALRSANLIVENEEKETEADFIEKVNILRSRLFGLNNDGYTVFRKGVENGLFEKNEYYLGFVESKKLRFESRGLFRNIEGLDFVESKRSGIFVSRLYLSDRSYILCKFLLEQGKEVYVGQRIHQGMEADVQNIVNATSTYEKVSLWKRKNSL